MQLSSMPSRNGVLPRVPSPVGAQSFGTRTTAEPRYTLTQQVGHLLVVSEGAAVRAVLASYFLRKGYRVWQVGTLQGARQLLQDRLPDLLLMDLHTPNSGEFVQLLRQQSRTAQIPMVLLLTPGTLPTCTQHLTLGRFDAVMEMAELGAIESKVASFLQNFPRLATAMIGQLDQEDLCGHGKLEQVSISRDGFVRPRAPPHGPHASRSS